MNKVIYGNSALQKTACRICELLSFLVQCVGDLINIALHSIILSGKIIIIGAGPDRDNALSIIIF
jgi:hypothetical protein